MRIWSTSSVIWLLWAMLLTDGAWAAKVPNEFNQHSNAGQNAYNAGDYDKAIQEFEAAYRLEPEPTLLINIGRSHAKADRPREALAFYQRALDMKLDRDVRAELNKSIDRATRRIAQQSSTTPQSSTAQQSGSSLQPSASQSGSSLQPSAPAAVSPTVALPPLLPKAPEVSDTPVYKKGWFWGIIGSAVVVAVGLGVGLGVGLRPAATENPKEVIQ